MIWIDGSAGEVGRQTLRQLLLVEDCDGPIEILHQTPEVQSSDRRDASTCVVGRGKPSVRRKLIKLCVFEIALHHGAEIVRLLPFVHTAILACCPSSRRWLTVHSVQQIEPNYFLAGARYRQPRDGTQAGRPSDYERGQLNGGLNRKPKF